MCLSQAWPTDDLSVSAASSPIKCTSKPPIFNKSLLCAPISNTLSSNCRISEEETHMLVRADNSPRKEPNIPEGTPAKRDSTPLRLMCNTPEIPTPKRRRPSPSCDSTPLNESLKHSTRTKLFMPPEKSAEAGEEENTGRSLSVAAAADDDDDDDDVLDILPESLLQSREMRKNLKEGSREGESRAGVGEGGHEGVVGGLEIEVELAGLLLGEFVGGTHLGEAGRPVADLGAALEVRGGGRCRALRGRWRDRRGGWTWSTATMLSLTESMAVMKCWTHSATAAAEAAAVDEPAARCSTVAGTPETRRRLMPAGASRR
ncbi:DNA replication initiation protein [Musa troglodytarum]|uniref:DNA replication initiation protein n=1 Tax=Musa troglodytarum TaxID=320322 RepID=A0A9E7HAA3_9LILI|nr:DNA replication initiation protein [Musa troglodytarum]